jgi:hypothetical protein
MVSQFRPDGVISFQWDPSRMHPIRGSFARPLSRQPVLRR